MNVPILNVNMDIIHKNLAYMGLVTVGMAGAFFFDHLATEIKTISWDYCMCSHFASLVFAIAAGIFAFKFIRNHDELKALVKNQEGTS